MREEWLSVLGHAGRVEVSNMGRVRSSKRGTVLKMDVNKGGYARVTLDQRKGSYTRRYVHHLVLETFIGPRPLGMDVLHNDGDVQNNCVSNLRWGTKRENYDDAICHAKTLRQTFSNNTSGHRGVFHTKSKRWLAYMGHAPRCNLGTFDTFEEAKHARLMAELTRAAEIAVRAQLGSMK